MFKISADGGLSSLYSFTGNDDGAYPCAGLVRGVDGDFYGTTEFGGTNGYNGTVFKISANGVLTSLYSFTGSDDGAYPAAGLVQAADGSFYGTTESGGAGGNGVVFRVYVSPAPPVIQTIGPAFGVQNNQFGFNVTGAIGSAFIIQASASLANPNWTPIATNILINGPFHFSDPQSTLYPSRFYRLESQ
ncbi:MAG TPA: choice-of-anchor tandem repeat GloVer-containing protein [Verrucomicrobiae bacterium]